MATSSPARRARQRRSQRNDAVILDASLQLAAREGWAGLTPGHVAEETGLSRPTVLQRHKDRASVGAALWRERIGQPLRDALEALLNAEDDPEALEAGLEPFVQPDSVFKAASELAVVASYVPEVAEAIEETLGPLLTAATSTRGSRSRSARRTFILALALGYTMESRRMGGLDMPIRPEVVRLSAALVNPSEPAKLPGRRAAHLDAPPVFDTGEDSWDAVLEATLHCVGELGYEAATIETIANTAGYTRTVIFRRYPTKFDLFSDASQRMLTPAVKLNDEYQTAIAKNHPMSVAEACFLREALRPERRRLRVITLEQVRLASRNPEIQRAIVHAMLQEGRPDVGIADREALLARYTTELAIVNGIALVAQLRPEVWRLPFDVVLTPWRETD